MNVYKHLVIDSPAFGGFGIGTYHGKKIFVPLTIPGERVACRIIESHNNYAWAELVDVEKAVPISQTTAVPLFRSMWRLPMAAY